MSDFKGRRFPTDIILVCVRWYCKFGISYRDLEEMMSERGVAVDHTTLFRWVPASWRVDETYVKVAGQWAYLYRAIDPLHCARRRLRIFHEFPAGLHAARPDRRYRVSEQGRHLRHPVQGIGRGHNHNRG